MISKPTLNRDPVFTANTALTAFLGAGYLRTHTPSPACKQAWDRGPRRAYWLYKWPLSGSGLQFKKLGTPEWESCSESDSLAYCPRASDPVSILKVIHVRARSAHSAISDSKSRNYPIANVGIPASSGGRKGAKLKKKEAAKGDPDIDRNYRKMWNSSLLKCLINSANALHWKTWIQLSLNQRFAHLRVRGALVRNSVYLRIAMRPLIELVKLGSHGAVTRTRKGQSARNIRRCFLRFRLPWTTRKRTDRSRYRIDEHPTAVHRYPYLE